MRACLALLLLLVSLSASAEWVYTCTGTRGETVNLAGQESPVCSPAASGQWVEINQYNFLEYEVPASQLADLLAVITGLFAMAYAIRLLIRALRGRS